MRSSFTLSLKGHDSVSIEKLAIIAVQKQNISPKPGPNSPRGSSISPFLSHRNSSKKSTLFYNVNAERVVSPQSAAFQGRKPSILLSNSGSQNNSPRKTFVPSSHPFFNVDPETPIRTPRRFRTTLSTLKPMKSPSQVENFRATNQIALNSQRSPQSDFDLKGYATVSSLDTSPMFWRTESVLSPRDPESRGIFMINKKKYKIKSPETALFSKTNGFQDKKMDINFIKEQAKLQVYRKSRMISPDKRMNGIGESDVLQKNRKDWTKEDEVKVDILKRKVEIFNKFQPSLTLDERKSLYKQMIFKYHPDKTQYKKEFAEEIFNYLQTNKSKFIPIL